VETGRLVGESATAEVVSVGDDEGRVDEGGTGDARGVWEAEAGAGDARGDRDGEACAGELEAVDGTQRSHSALAAMYALRRHAIP